jgi:hypothetical protein
MPLAKVPVNPILYLSDQIQHESGQRRWRKLFESLTKWDTRSTVEQQ